MKFIILFLFFLVPAALAEDKGIFYILDEKFIDNIDELPYSEGTPDKQTQNSDHIEAWIDIVGFRQMAHENGFDYVPGDPANYSIIQYYAKGTHYGITESLQKTVSVQQSGANITASLSVVLKWYTLSCDKFGCWPVRRTETATFQDIEPAPKIYPLIQGNVKASVIQYNNSLYENIGIQIANPAGISKTKISYKDKTAMYRRNVGHVEKTNKGIYFANMTPSEYWELRGSNISRIGNTIFMNGNLSELDLSELHISGSNIYETIDTDPKTYNVSRLEFRPENDVQNPVLLSFLCVVGVMFAGLSFYVKGMVKKWIREL